MKKNVGRGIAAILLVFALVLAGCNKGSDISGTWRGNIDGYGVTVTISKIGWSISIPDADYADTGTYMRDGNVGRFTSDTNGQTIGTGERLDGNTIRITLNSNSIAPGTHTLTRSTGGGSSSDKADAESDFKVSPLEDGKSAVITEYVGSKQTVNIPSYIQGMIVTKIGDGAFRDKKEIIKVIIPKGVTSIGDMAFYGCTGLTSITIPASVTSIGGAFAGCVGLTSITIPASVTSISPLAFSYCTSLTSIKVDSGNLNYSSKGGILYNKAKTELIQAPPAGISGAVTIPASVTSIGNGAFQNCANLTGVTIPNSVTSIGNTAFFRCTSLTSITIPADVTSINPFTFADCTSLASITIPASVTSISFLAFSGCTSLTSITIPKGVTAIGEGAFGQWTSSQTINIEGHDSQTAADRAWGASWRSGCNARIIYQGGN